MDVCYLYAAQSFGVHLSRLWTVFRPCMVMVVYLSHMRGYGQGVAVSLLGSAFDTSFIDILRREYQKEPGEELIRGVAYDSIEDYHAKVKHIMQKRLINTS
jgi:hypothetical protein